MLYISKNKYMFAMSYIIDKFKNAKYAIKLYY